MILFRLIFMPKAAADLRDIQDYIARDSRKNAEQMIARILDALESLKEFPHRTVAERQNRRLKHPTRTLSVKPYVVYFRVIDEWRAVRILHVRHGARKRPRL
jgi:plasmid stabilization system protein ParE